jgi:catechol 2,3-dioxygenase-like lactoylglutathione lyase family enzyme
VIVMKMKSVSGLTCSVQDLNRTVEFYEKLGFTFRMKTPEHATAYLNWFWIDFIAAGEQPSRHGGGPSICISVEDVDEFYQGALALDFQPTEAPVDTPSGDRQFLLNDPDGYRLVFFKRK